MRHRYVVAGALCLVVVALVVGMFWFAAGIAERERSYREEGAKLDGAEMLAFDLSMWWHNYGWVAGPMAVLAALVGAAFIVRPGAGRRESGSLSA